MHPEILKALEEAETLAKQTEKNEKIVQARDAVRAEKLKLKALNKAFNKALGNGAMSSLLGAFRFSADTRLLPTLYAIVQGSFSNESIRNTEYKQFLNSIHREVISSIYTVPNGDFTTYRQRCNQFKMLTKVRTLHFDALNIKPCPIPDTSLRFIDGTHALRQLSADILDILDSVLAEFWTLHNRKTNTVRLVSKCTDLHIYERVLEGLQEIAGLKPTRKALQASTTYDKREQSASRRGVVVTLKAKGKKTLKVTGYQPKALPEHLHERTDSKTLNGKWYSLNQFNMLNQRGDI